MRWKGRRQSDHVVDQRGRRRVSKRGASGGAAILLLLIGLFFGTDVSNILAPLLSGGLGTQSQTQTVSAPQNDEASQFVRTILAETEDTWNAVFAQMGRQYRKPKLVLYSGMVQSACGVGSAQAGPFYCPGDYQIYIDLSFLEQLKRMGAPGDFAFAYVIAHEVGHHVQNLVGIASQVREQQMRVSKTQSNALSVKMELQAD
ncbi:MAG: neutral zinc metallopeptidase, partial [Pseudomonadota bacterium]